MASFSLEEFVGSGVLQPLLPTLAEEGWDDVPTLKLMITEDMETLNLSQQQRDALEIRSYLHDRSLMEYADKLEASGKGLQELLNLTPSILSTQFGMRRGHVARFVDRTMACGIVTPPSFIPVPASRRRSSDTFSKASLDSESSQSSPAHSLSGAKSFLMGSANSFNSVSDGGRDRSSAPGGPLKGIVAAVPPEPRLCGFIGPAPVVQDVAHFSVLEKVSLQKITPEYRPSSNPWSQNELKLPPPMKAADIWARKTTIIFCIRRPGCVMCRAEAHQIYSRKPIFDALGVQLVAVVNELIEAEIKSFWPRFWGGMTLVDENRDFFKALGGGTLPKEGFITGFVLNPVARANYRRAKATGIESNYTGEGTIKGGLFILRPGRGGVAYQFVERNFGDWAPLEEVLEVCGKIYQQRRPTTIQEDSVEYFQSK